MSGEILLTKLLKKFKAGIGKILTVAVIQAQVSHFAGPATEASYWIYKFEC